MVLTFVSISTGTYLDMIHMDGYRITAIELLCGKSESMVQNLINFFWNHFVEKIK